MTQSELNRSVAQVTGESVATINGLGFSLADPDDVHFDPEPSDFDDELKAKIIDWDELDAERNVPLVYQPVA